MSYCDHTESTPADGHRTCNTCGVHLPEHWDCPNCEFADVSSWSEPQGLRWIPAQPCVRHTDWRPKPRS